MPANLLFKLSGMIFDWEGLNFNPMYSHQNSQTVSDRYNTRGADSETLQHLSRKLDYPVEDILRAIQEVGTNADEVDEYIRDRYNRS